MNEKVMNRVVEELQQSLAEANARAEQERRSAAQFEDLLNVQNSTLKLYEQEIEERRIEVENLERANEVLSRYCDLQTKANLFSRTLALLSSGGLFVLSVIMLIV